MPLQHHRVGRPTPPVKFLALWLFPLNEMRMKAETAAGAGFASAIAGAPPRPSSGRAGEGVPTGRGSGGVVEAAAGFLFTPLPSLVCARTHRQSGIVS